MENQSPSIKSIGFNYGIILALVSIIVLVIMYIGNIEKSWPLSIGSMIATIIVFIYGIKAYKNANGNLLSVKEAIKVGLAIAVIGGIIAAIYSYIHYSMIYPEFIEMTKETSYQQMMERNPNMTDEQASQAMDMSSMFMTPAFFSLMSIIGSLFFGLIISIIAGLIMKQE